MEAILQQKPKRGLKSVGGGLDEDEDDTERSYDPVVASAMQELQAKKRAKKGLGVDAKGKKGNSKGLTLEEVEEQEGGIVKESKLGMAATQRAERRKGKLSKDETEMLAVDDMIDAEEALRQEEDEGQKLEPFNLAKERQEGRFDESGMYVENKEEEDPTLQDAWLTSTDAEVASDAVRRKVEAQNAKMEAADAAPQMTALQTANYMRTIIAHLLPRETVNRALRRLRPKQDQQPKRTNKKDEKSKEDISKQLATESSQDKTKFDEITEAAMTLMDAGELDIYSLPKEDLEEKAARTPAEANDFDMFGEPIAPLDVTPPVATGNSLQEAYQEPEVDYSTWPIKELARFLRERGVDPIGLVEKSDMVAKVTELASKGPEGGDSASGDPNLPEGYVWDPESKYYFNAESGFYYDQNSASYFSTTDGKWYKLDSSTGQYVDSPAY